MELTDECYSGGDSQGLPGFIHPRVLGIPTISFQNSTLNRAKTATRKFWSSEISKWIILIEVIPVSQTEHCFQNRANRFELADLGLNFHHPKSILPPASRRSRLKFSHLHNFTVKQQSRSSHARRSPSPLATIGRLSSSVAGRCLSPSFSLSLLFSFSRSLSLSSSVFVRCLSPFLALLLALSLSLSSSFSPSSCASTSSRKRSTTCDIVPRCDGSCSEARGVGTACESVDKREYTHVWRGGGLGSRPKKMYGERLGDGVEYHSMSPTPRR